jgi:hypothetical protein
MSDSTEETLDHIDQVQARLHDVVTNLSRRSSQHDHSKLEEPERSGFDAGAEYFRTVKYGTPEYRAALDNLRPTIEHHYRVNDHHPEHFPGGIQDMNLLQLLEMLCDWKASTERKSGVSLRKSLEINRERFQIPDALFRCIESTAEELGWL